MKMPTKLQYSIDNEHGINYLQMTFFLIELQSNIPVIYYNNKNIRMIKMHLKSEPTEALRSGAG